MRVLGGFIVAAAAALLRAPPAAAVTNGPAPDSRCITVKDVVIVGGAETWADKKLCKSPGSARYDVIEVAAAVYGAASTKASFEQLADPKLRAQRAEIEALQARTHDGRTEAEADQLALLRIQQRFVTALAAKDHAYAEAIAQFRKSVVDLTSTPEGLEALAQYNAGDEAGALSILDRLRAANDAARKTQSDLASAAEGRRIARLALDAHGKGRVTTAAAIARYEDVTRLDPGVFGDWNALVDLYQEAGSLTDAASAAQHSLKVAISNNEKGAALANLALILVNQGQLTDASKIYEESLAIRQKVAIANPADAQSQRNLSIAIERIGDVKQAQFDRAGAEREYIESLKIRRQLAAADPSDVQTQRDIHYSLILLGESRLARDDLVGAIEAITESVAIARKLVAADPASINAQFDISGSLYDLGQIRLNQNDLTGADEAISEFHAVSRKLAADDPSNAHAQFNVANSFELIGDLKMKQNNLSLAEPAYANALNVYQKLAVADPSNTYAQKDLILILERIGNLQFARDDLTGSERTYREGLAIARKLAPPSSGVTAVLQGVAELVDSVGDVLLKRSDITGAEKAYSESLDIRRKLLSKNPGASCQCLLAHGLEKIGDVRLAQHHVAAAKALYVEALAIRRKLVSANPDDAGEQSDLGMTLARLAKVPDSGVRWRDVAAQWEIMAAKGLLAPSDRKQLDLARAKAAGEG